jgi:hypothetical protein
LRGLLVVLCVLAGLCAVGVPTGALAAPAVSSSSSSGTTGLGSTGSSAPVLPQGSDGDSGPLTPMSSVSSASQQADEAAESAASKEAKSSGKPVSVAPLTTATATTTADPDGELTYTGYVLPVRVQRGKSWVPVSTTLARGSDGMLSAAAVPGDSVEFSDGGSGQLAVITADGTSLSLSWPGSVPAPVPARAIRITATRTFTQVRFAS